MSDGDYYLAPDLYDAVYADVTADIAPHVALMRGAGGPALELCCGNGRLLLPTLRCCRHHLDSGGRLELTAFHPSAERLLHGSGEEKLLKSLPHGAGLVRVWDRADDDRVAGLIA